MEPLINVNTYDITHNEEKDLKDYIKRNCISIHIPLTNENRSFIDKENYLDEGFFNSNQYLKRSNSK